MKTHLLLLALVGWIFFQKTHHAIESFYYDTASGRYVYLSYLA